MSGEPSSQVVAKPMPVLERPGLIDEVVAAFLAGNSLLEIAREMGAPPSAFAAWLNQHHPQAYGEALRLRADHLVRQCLPIADGATQETVQVDRLRIETRLRLAGKWDKAMYGDQRQITGAGGGPVEVDVRQVGDRDLARRVALLLTSAVKE